MVKSLYGLVVEQLQADSNLGGGDGIKELMLELKREHLFKHHFQVKLDMLNTTMVVLATML